MSKRGVTRFQPCWEKEFVWVKPMVKNPVRAQCELCKKDFVIESMGRQALVSHAASKKHKEAFRVASSSTPMDVFLRRPVSLLPSSAEPSTSTEPATSAGQSDRPTVPSTTTSLVCTGSSVNHLGSSVTPSIQERVFPTLKDKWMDSYLAKNITTTREIMWCLGTVMHHESLRVSQSRVELFKLMFANIEEVQELELGKTKTGYVIVYGLGPYFKSELDTIVKSSDFFVFGFDESFNKVAQSQQMDVNVRFWHRERNEVCTRYLTSVFLQHTTSEDLLKAFMEAITGYPTDKIMQVSMDGPNVNLKFFRLLKEAIKGVNNDSPQMLDIGSCGIHKLHCAFKCGIKATGWGLIEFFRALYNLFLHAPSRRGDFARITGTTTFPLKFCAVRWLENVNVANRAQVILPHVIKYVKEIQEGKSVPGCKSFTIVQTQLQDKLLPAKIAFFSSMADEAEPFLREYQTDAPMIPFLYDSLFRLVRCGLERVVKPDILSSNELCKIDLNKKENLKRAQDFDLGYATREALRKCHNVKDIDILYFHKECMNALSLFVKKLLECSPLKYSLTKAVSCLNPDQIVSDAGVTELLRSALEILVKTKRVSGSAADKIEREFRAFCNEEIVRNAMSNYSRSEERIDHFWMRLLGVDKWTHLKSFVTICLVLLHGNASLERGFSVNKECLVENLSENSLIAQRLIYDAVSASGGIQNMTITKPMINATRNAHARYKEALAQRQEENKGLKRKAEVKKRAELEKKELNVKKQMILKEIEEKRAEVNRIDTKVKCLRNM